MWKWVPGTSGRMVDMKTVRLLVDKGNNKANTRVEYDDASAEWLVANGYALAEPDRAPAKPSGRSTGEVPAAPRRGRPRKADKS